MAYCVHCGVKLAPSEQVCPLCNTEVIDPKEPHDPTAPKPYPSTLDIFTYEKQRWLWILSASILLAMPAAICAACDFAYTDWNGWSLLVIGAMALVWVLTVPHLFVHKGSVTLHIILDSATLVGYLYLIERYTEGDWWLPLAMPIVLLTAAVTVTEYLLMKYKVHDPLLRTALALGGMPFLVVGIEIALDLYIGGSVSLLWSWIVSIPCVLIGAFLLVLFRQAKLRSQVHRRLFL